MGDDGKVLDFGWRNSQEPTLNGKRDNPGFMQIHNGTTKLRVSYEVQEAGSERTLRVTDITVLP